MQITRLSKSYNGKVKKKEQNEKSNGDRIRNSLNKNKSKASSMARERSSQTTRRKKSNRN